MPLHVAIKRKVKVGSEEAFEEAVKEFFKESLSAHGVLGTHLLRPLQAEANEYGILRSFSDEAARNQFYSSNLFQDWNEKVQQWTEGPPERHQLSGFELWFRDGLPDPWKMALITWLGVWPVSTLIGGWVGPLFPAGTSPWLSGAVISALIVLALTWPVMPLLTRLFKNWL